MTDRDRLIVHGGAVLSPDAEHVLDADLLIEDGVIAQIRARVHGADPFAGVDGRRLDARRRLVAPGFVNGHTHSHTGILGGIARDWTLEHSLINGPWTGAERSVELTRISALLVATELVASGCTSLFDLVYRFPDIDEESFLATAEAYRDVGLRATLAPMVADRTLFEALPALASCGHAAPARAQTLPAAADIIAACTRLIETWPYDRTLLAPAVAPTIPAHCSDELLDGLDRLSRETGVRLHMHLAESKPQARAGAQRYGRSITAELDARGMLRPGVTVAHAVWTDGADARLLAAGGVDVVTVPGSNMRLGSGLQDSRALLEAGARLAIGTDGANSADALDMLHAVQLTSSVSHVFDRPAGEWLTPGEVLRAATAGGAEAVGLGALTGRISEGFAADLVFWDLGAAAFTPGIDLVNQIVTAARIGDVRTVMVGGRVAMDGGVVAGVDVARLRDRAAELCEEYFAAAKRRRAAAGEIADAARDVLAGQRRLPWRPERLLPATAD
ncbi:amidohydrolase family protein [Microbacterium sp. SSW1-59]|uniref:amidohydrolase family protein n=1 Tax=Microbacterium xanthum TaxID=3079794 RepID=UPI002AD319DB|nr:amidohydrolase family protein [Microbacterium sp. SSW1-59]MDZ8200926.1 amidohydrolase family protein [Microbacterium sp. SSW1-59]